MIVLTPTTDKIQLVTAAAGDLDVHASWIDWNTTTEKSSSGRLNTNILTATTTDITGSPGANVERSIKKITINNVHASLPNTITIQHVGNITIDLRTVTLLPGEELLLGENGIWFHYDATGGVKSAASVVSPVSCKELTADVTNNTVTAALVTGLSMNMPVGTWHFRYVLRYQTAATTTGIKFSVNHTGTVAAFESVLSYVDAAATASTGAPSQAANASTAQVMGAYSARAKSTAAGMGPTLSVDVANADMLAILEGHIIVTAGGNVELYFASEVAASNAVLKSGSGLILTRISA